MRQDVYEVSKIDESIAVENVEIADVERWRENFERWLAATQPKQRWSTAFLAVAALAAWGFALLSTVSTFAR